MSLVFLALFLLMSPSEHLRSISTLLLSVAWVSSYITRKLAYPNLTAGQFSAPEPPLSLFPH